MCKFSLVFVRYRYCWHSCVHTGCLNVLDVLENSAKCTAPAVAIFG
jgi:hypothetical protein